LFQFVVLVVTFLVSAANIKQIFSVLNIVKTKLRNKNEDGFLTDTLMLYIERETTAKYSINYITYDFQDIRE
jgi:hypothetical protein